MGLSIELAPCVVVIRAAVQSLSSCFRNPNPIPTPIHGRVSELMLAQVRSGGHGAINKYGRGAYVSALHNFAYSAGSYCCDVEFVDGQTYKMIFLCSVLPGALCKTPQGKFIEKDSSVDCLQNPKIYALSRQNQCAVKYAVLFRDI